MIMHQSFKTFFNDNTQINYSGDQFLHRQTADADERDHFLIYFSVGSSNSFNKWN